MEIQGQEKKKGEIFISSTTIVMVIILIALILSVIFDVGGMRKQGIILLCIYGGFVLVAIILSLVDRYSKH